MDGPSAQASFDVGTPALKLLITVSLGLLGAILWNYDARIRNLEEAKLTKDDVKDAVKAVLHDDETLRKRR